MLCTVEHIFFTLTFSIENKIFKPLGYLFKNHCSTVELPFELSFASTTFFIFKAKILIHRI